MNTEEQKETVVPKKSKGQLFREKYGFTPTMRRNMVRKGLDPMLPESLEAYRKGRKPLRAQRAATKRKKHDAAKSGRKTKAPATKTKSIKDE